MTPPRAASSPQNRLVHSSDHSLSQIIRQKVYLYLHFLKQSYNVLYGPPSAHD